MASLHVEVVVGIAAGVLLGVVPGIVAGVLGALSEYVEGWSIPRAVPPILGVVVAGGLGYGVGLVEVAGGQVLRIVAAGVVVVFLCLYGFSRGVALAAALPRDSRRDVERGRPLAAAALEAVDATGQVTIRPTGDVRTIDGYPSLPADLREQLAATSVQLPADLPLGELEARIEGQLRSRFDLAAVSVSVDSRGRATVAAAPPVSGIARYVPDGYRAVSVRSSIPASVDRGDEVRLETDGGGVDGVLLDTSLARERRGGGDPPEVVPGAGESPGSTSAPAGGPLCRVTVAVPTASADTLLSAETATVAVRPRDTRADFRALSLLERAEAAVRATTVDAEVLEALRSDDPAPTVFAARPPEDRADWQFAPEPSDLAVGWHAFVVGDPTTLQDLVGGADSAIPGVVGA